MVSVDSPPGRRELPYARTLLLPAILMAAATGAAVALGLSYTVLGGPLTTFTQAAATELLARTPYIEAVLGR